MPFTPGFPMVVVEPMQVDAEGENEHNEQSEEPDQNFVIENPSLDLEGYANSYSGFMQIRRLLFVAKHSPSLRIESYKLALKHVKKTLNIQLYQQIHEKLIEAMRAVNASSAVDAHPLDLQWIEQTSKHAETLLEKLDTDLKNFKNNAIKESIRRGLDDLGSHHLNMGDLPQALKCYSRVRDYCSSPKNIVNMCLNVIKVCVYLGNWPHILSYVGKAESSGCLTEKDHHTLHLQTKLRCAAGLANLALGKYKLAAKYFLQSTVDHCDFPELMSPSNVTVYGSLCALATFSREELQTLLINCSSFKLMLELEPTVREVVFAFYKSEYARCLELLWKINDNLLLDQHLSPHVSNLCQQIRMRALVQYFSPYRVADMHKMAAAFKCTVKELEDELMPLILNGQITARIDSQRKVLQVRQTNQRSLTFAKSFKVGADYLHRGKSLVLRNAVIKSNIQVQPSDISK